MVCINRCPITGLFRYEPFGLTQCGKRPTNLFPFNDYERMRGINNLLIQQSSEHTGIVVA
jgi:hypothetical protein